LRNMLCISCSLGEKATYIRKQKFAVK